MMLIYISVRLSKYKRLYQLCDQFYTPIGLRIRATSSSSMLIISLTCNVIYRSETFCWRTAQTRSHDADPQADLSVNAGRICDMVVIYLNVVNTNTFHLFPSINVISYLICTLSESVRF